MDTIVDNLNWAPDTGFIDQTRESAGPGNVVMIEAGSSQVTEVFSVASRAAAGEHLTDQLLLPMALAGSGSFAALKLSRHTRTNMEVIPRFLPVRFETQEEDGYVQVGVLNG